MLGSYNIHTDLALEDKERFESDNVEVSGVSVEEFYDEEKEIRITEVKILTENGAKTMRKPIGTYITMEMPNLVISDEEYHHIVAEELAKYVGNILNMKKEEYTALVVGLGNRDVTPDALGPHTIECLNVTRHIVREYGKYALGEDAMQMVSAIAPGVMAQTGMESFEIIKGISEIVQPDVVIVVDALAARNTKRLNRTIQIADTGIHPGSGVGNHRNALTEEALGIPVLALGVPTVIEISEPEFGPMYVTPHNIDERVEMLSYTISEALHEALFR